MSAKKGFYIVAINRETGETVRTLCTDYQYRKSLLKRLEKNGKMQIKVVDPCNAISWSDFSRDLL